MGLEELTNSYLKKRVLIEKRLQEFKKPRSDDALFAELAFCLMTPQSKAKLCWNSVKMLKEKNILFSNAGKIRPYLNCRFGNNKARYIEEAAKRFDEIKKRLQDDDKKEIRNWLVKNIKGLGYKEASHFLRNIGVDDFAILDRHILKNLKQYGVIEEVPKSLTPKKYLEIEKKMDEFSKRIGIPLPHLDLLLWSNETGEIFK
jgi:N-glycosylase/DNA lyase